MVTFLLDASAILRYVDNEAGASRVEEILQEAFRQRAIVAVSAIHWGEVAGKLYKMRGLAVMDRTLRSLASLGITIVPVDPGTAVKAALIKADLRIPYVDAFGPALASPPGSVFVTADFDLKAAEKLAAIEFLPVK